MTQQVLLVQINVYQIDSSKYATNISNILYCLNIINKYSTCILTEQQLHNTTFNQIQNTIN